MGYKSLEQCIYDLEKNGNVRVISNEINPDLDIATIHLNEFKKGKKVLLFNNVFGSKFRAVSNIFGTVERGRYIFRDSLKIVKTLIAIKLDPLSVFKNPIYSFVSLLNGIYAIPKKVKFPKKFSEIKIEELPQIKCWEQDGGAFITLPQVYSEDIDKPGILNSNLGMYRIQLSGNQYEINNEVGMHYQLHRGIGVHQKKAIKKGKPLKVSIFVGGPPAHTFASVMPLPEGLSEISFAGVLAKRATILAHRRAGDQIEKIAR